jgi:hypothetical protein
MLWVFTWDLTVTPVVYAVVGETASTRLRSKSIGLARNFYNVLGIPGGIINTYSINPEAWGWKGRASFFWVCTPSRSANLHCDICSLAHVCWWAYGHSSDSQNVKGE